MDIGELGAYIWSYLYGNGINCVLSGGACVSIYSQNKYQSFDLDFIENVSTSRKEITMLLNKIGFKENNRYYVNDETKFFIEFPSGPLSAGSEPIKSYNELTFETGILRLLTPTDCVKDRLAAYFHWDDKQSLDQAILVSESNPIDMKEIKRWSIYEGCSDKFNSIQVKFKKPKI